MEYSKPFKAVLIHEIPSSLLIGFRRIQFWYWNLCTRFQQRPDDFKICFKCMRMLPLAPVPESDSSTVNAVGGHVKYRIEQSLPLSAQVYMQIIFSV
jgi:hypothetical protein